MLALKQVNSLPNKKSETLGSPMLDKEEIYRLKRVFHMLDKDKNGKLSKEELRNGLKIAVDMQKDVDHT